MKRSTAAYKKVSEDASIGSTYIADTSEVGSQISGEPVQRIKIPEHRQILQFNVPNLEVSKVYKLPLEGGYARSLIKPVIMAGGNGKRLWPLSSKDKPKQFKKILSGLTLLQQTLNRNKFLGQPTIITLKKYESITKEQATEIDVEITLITEPLQKNTAVCAIITTLSATALGFDIVVLLPSNHSR
ncbi:MAG TPA: palindromic element RPE5 domain-containing protein [Rickettsia endosymbiont of Proechinophthirus fluctus]|nr:sugar phosphate nucleotidyltransferase [Rickettsia endosymbiont of Proechinophthirus fluctus]HJD54828.1 palindromic element RPE5 domain-containing protein [Rickettsia endosymbiont of Proechinophthirus fluctus]